MTRPRTAKLYARWILSILAISSACQDDGQNTDSAPSSATAGPGHGQSLPMVQDAAGTRVEAGQSPAEAQTGGSTSSVAQPDGAAGAMVLPESPFPDEDWAKGLDLEGPVGADDTEIVAAAAGPFPGPCKISWNDQGAVIRLGYTETGGHLRVDEDGDGGYETCQMFTRVDGRTTKMAIDQGCDKSTDLRVTPSYEDNVNIGAAKVTGTGTEPREVTLVWLPGIFGFEPALVIDAPRSQVNANIKDGLVKRVTVAGAQDHAGMRVTLTYDKERRIKSLQQDFGLDGKIDRKFAYSFDARGNLNRVDATLLTSDGSGRPGVEVKRRAKFDYGCWK